MESVFVDSVFKDLTRFLVIRYLLALRNWFFSSLDSVFVDSVFTGFYSRTRTPGLSVFTLGHPGPGLPWLCPSGLILFFVSGLALICFTQLLFRHFKKSVYPNLNLSGWTFPITFFEFRLLLLVVEIQNSKWNQEPIL
jgi:hypothetical protein